MNGMKYASDSIGRLSGKDRIVGNWCSDLNESEMFIFHIADIAFF